MKITLIIFVTSVHHEPTEENTKPLMKSFESNIRPAIGDIIEDSGFDSRFHNSYEVAKVTINYSLNECFVSLAPLVMEIEDMSAEEYIEKLKNNGWKDYKID
ncbi:hypothetical protein MM221_01790 [Salipaludibacillus sp. LMS25]|uniref:hypothetical protein n=1 Tax=Salipaludibacillus sp. LMS25 TaxID=2924031 RepID=UPI0020D058A1|nr:hypothetical protein [Salipaludibacillus sp. LMS25]UTR15350.1 hypothetical protein MM221_01790 [Salipaludibacillus sp. LMS25]